MQFPVRRPETCLAAILPGLVLTGGSRAGAQPIPLPVIRRAVFNITGYGAVADGQTWNTAATFAAVAIKRR